MQHQVGVVWITQRVRDAMIVEACRTCPKESGGLLLGYWAARFDEAVITDMIGPGPAAIHEEHRFVPDADYQESILAQRYLDAPHRNAYLGDWHSHPHGGPWLSPKDRRTLREIAQYSDAQAPVPLMAILSSGNPWHVTIWRFRPRQSRMARLHRQFSSLKVRIYPDPLETENP